ncbi:unnamed protein product [Mucor hiemalis]
MKRGIFQKSAIEIFKKKIIRVLVSVQYMTNNDLYSDSILSIELLKSELTSDRAKRCLKQLLERTKNRLQTIENNNYKTNAPSTSTTINSRATGSIVDNGNVNRQTYNINNTITADTRKGKEVKKRRTIELSDTEEEEKEEEEEAANEPLNVPVNKLAYLDGGEMEVQIDDTTHNWYIEDVNVSKNFHEYRNIYQSIPLVHRRVST